MNLDPGITNDEKISEPKMNTSGTKSIVSPIFLPAEEKLEEPTQPSIEMVSHSKRSSLEGTVILNVAAQQNATTSANEVSFNHDLNAMINESFRSRYNSMQMTREGQMKESSY